MSWLTGSPPATPPKARRWMWAIEDVLEGEVYQPFAGAMADAGYSRTKMPAAMMPETYPTVSNTMAA